MNHFPLITQKVKSHPKFTLLQKVISVHQNNLLSVHPFTSIFADFLKYLNLIWLVTIKYDHVTEMLCSFKASFHVSTARIFLGLHICYTVGSYIPRKELHHKSQTSSSQNTHVLWIWPIVRSPGEALLLLLSPLQEKGRELAAGLCPLSNGRFREQLKLHGKATNSSCILNHYMADNWPKLHHRVPCCK